MKRSKSYPARVRTTAVLLALAMGPACFGACSLTSMVDVKVGECPSDDTEGDAYCRRVLNPVDGNYEECASYECVRFEDYFQCQPIEEEICDGEDNDCDYLIDEPPGRSSESIFELSSSTLVDGVDLVKNASLTQSSNFGEVLYLATEEGGAEAVDLGGESASSEPVTLWAQMFDDSRPIEDFDKQELTALEAGCYKPSQAGGPSQCSIIDARVAAGERLGFFAYVNGLGCSSGELRVGAIDARHKEEFIDRGTTFRAPTYRGVRTLGSACSSNLSDACEDLKKNQEDFDSAGEFNEALREACGVSRPAIAAIDTQALVAYMGTSAASTSCPDEEANVLALLLHERIEEFGETFVWADPSDDGEPISLGTTLSGDSPGILALKDEGFLVASGDADQKIRLSFVPKQAKPPQTDGLDCDGDCDARSYHTDPIVDLKKNWETLQLSGSGAIADGIRLTLLDLEDDEDEDQDHVLILVTWVEGCSLDAGGHDAFFRMLRVDLSGSVPELVESYPLGALGKSTRAPLSVPSSQDFVVAGLERGGKEASDSTKNGFYVLSTDGDLRLTRVAAFDGKLLHPSETLVDDGVGTYIAGAGEDRFFTHRADDQQVLTARVTCD